MLKNKKVAVIGSGMTGLETSEMLAENGNDITVVEMADSIAPGTWMQHIDDCMPRLKAHGVKFIVGHKLTEITDRGIELNKVDTENILLVDADYVVLSLGVRPENKLYDDINGKLKNVYLIGDAEKTGRIADATSQAYELCKNI